MNTRNSPVPFPARREDLRPSTALDRRPELQRLRDRGGRRLRPPHLQPYGCRPRRGGRPMTTVRYVLTKEIKRAVRGQEERVLAVLGIPWRRGQKPITCPFHGGKSDWRWD